MKSDFKPEINKCSTQAVCGWLENAITGMNGKSNGINVNTMIDLTTGKESVRYSIVFERRPKKGDVGGIYIQFCPFCGVEFNAGWPMVHLGSNELPQE